MILADIINNLLPLWIVLIVLVIGVVVFLLRKYVPGLGNHDEEVDEDKRVEEEVNRMIVNPSEKQDETTKDDEQK